MKSLTFKIITDPKEAKEMWEKLSPHKTLDDEWDFRDIWTNELHFPFHFIVGYDGDKVVGLLPLQVNTGKGLAAKHFDRSEPFLEFFGGIDIDDTRVWTVPGYEDTVVDFLKQIHSPAILSYLRDPYIVDENKASLYVDRFELDLQQYQNIQEFMQKNFDGKSRQRLINRLNKLRKTYDITITDGKEADLELLYKLSIERFGERSSFNLQQRRNVFKNFLKRFTVDLFIIKLNGESKATSYSILFNNTYTTMSIGYDAAIRDLSKLLIVTQIQRALEKGCTTFDAGKGDNGWKSHFNLKRIPQYKLNIE